MTNHKKHTTPWFFAALMVFALVGPLGCGDDDSGGNNNNTAVDASVDDGGLDAAVDGTVSNAPYPGAPPNMPHAPSSCSMNCLTCHAAGVAGAPITPHPERLMCLQCHLPQNDVPNFVDSNFTAFP